MSAHKTVLIVQSSGSETGGGSFESLYQYLRVMDRTQFRPIVVCFNHTAYVDHIRDMGIDVHILQDWIYTERTRKLRRWIINKIRRAAIRFNRFTPRVLPAVLRLIHRRTIARLVALGKHEQAALIDLNIQPYRDFPGIVAAERLGIPCVCHLRSADPATRGQFNPAMAAYANRVVAAYVANSHVTRNYWVGHGLAVGKLHTVFNGIELSPVEPEDVRSRWGIPRDAAVAIMVVPLRSRLKIDEFSIRAFAALLQRRPRTFLLVVGDGPMRSVIERESHVLGVDTQVIMAGNQDQPLGMLAGADVSLVLNSFDTFGRVSIETLHAGTPLVASDVGGIREIIDDGYNGLLAAYGDAFATALAIERAIDDSELRERLIENGRKTVRDRLSIQSYASGMAEVYDAVVLTMPATLAED